MNNSYTPSRRRLAPTLTRNASYLPTISNVSTPTTTITQSQSSPFKSKRPGILKERFEIRSSSHIKLHNRSVQLSLPTLPSLPLSTRNLQSKEPIKFIPNFDSFTIRQSFLAPGSQDISEFDQETPVNTYEDVIKNAYNDDEKIIPTSLSHLHPEKLINLELKLKNSALQASTSTAQSLPLLVSLTTEDFQPENRIPVDLVYVLDHSGSMMGEKLQMVKNSFEYLLPNLNEKDRLAIIIFNDQATRLVPLVRTTESNKRYILSALESIYAHGGTDINFGIMHAFHLLKERRYANPLTSIFLLSDGLDGGAQAKVKESMMKFRIPTNVSINTFGFGRDHDPKLMTDIADLSDGNYYFIEQLDTIDESFVDCLGGLQSSVAQSIELSIKGDRSELLQGVKINRAYGNTSMWRLKEKSFVTRMANLVSGRQKNFLLELKIPAISQEFQERSKKVKVATAQAVIKTFDNQEIVLNSKLAITLWNDLEGFCGEPEDDKEVMGNFYRVRGATLMDEARKLADLRNYETGKENLIAFKQELSKCEMKKDEFILSLIKDIERAIEDIRPANYKRAGKLSIYCNQRAQVMEKSNFSSGNCYQNNLQKEMIAEVKEKKAMKSSKYRSQVNRKTLLPPPLFEE